MCLVFDVDGPADIMKHDSHGSNNAAPECGIYSFACQQTDTLFFAAPA